MRILFVWTGLTSYMGDCWRALAKAPGVDLRVIVDDTGGSSKSVSFEAAIVMRDIRYQIVADGTGGIDDMLLEWCPDIIFAVGWRSGVCRSIVKDHRFKKVPKVCCFDMPWRWQFRCLAAPFVLGRFLRNYQAAFVPGQVCARYAKWLGFDRIYRGLFAIDTGRFARGEDSSGARDYFLYVGRNSSEKRLDDLRAAHRIYRERGGKFGLKMYGKGLEGGFVRPEDVPGLMHGAAAFVLASEFDPWPLVLLEAMSAGCPVIASDHCTNRPELGKNWRVFRCGDVKALSQELFAVESHGRDEAVDRVVAENVGLARRYDCAEWVNRVMDIVNEMV